MGCRARAEPKGRCRRCMGGISPRGASAASDELHWALAMLGERVCDGFWQRGLINTRRVIGSWVQQRFGRVSLLCQTWATLPQKQQRARWRGAGGPCPGDLKDLNFNLKSHLQPQSYSLCHGFYTTLRAPSITDDFLEGDCTCPKVSLLSERADGFGSQPLVCR